MGGLGRQRTSAALPMASLPAAAAALRRFIPPPALRLSPSKPPSTDFCQKTLGAARGLLAGREGYEPVPAVDARADAVQAAPAGDTRVANASAEAE